MIPIRCWVSPAPPQTRKSKKPIGIWPKSTIPITITTIPWPIWRKRGASGSGYGAYGGSYGGYGANSYGGSYDPAIQRIRLAIRQGDLNLAEELLNARSDHNAEWNFLKGAVCFKRGWLDEAKRYYETAVQMDPGNPEYRQALAMAEGRSAGYRPAGYSRVTTDGCDDPCTRLCGTMLCCNLLGGGGYFCCI